MWPGDVVLNTAEMQGVRKEWAEGTATRLSGMAVLRVYRSGYDGEGEFGEDADEHWLERYLPDNIRPDQCKLMDGERDLENVVGEVLAQISSDKKFRDQKSVMPMVTSLPPPWYRKELAARPVPNPPVFCRTEGVHVWKGRKSPSGDEAAFELVITKTEDKLKLYCLHGKDPQPCIDCRNETRAFWENPDAVKKNAEDVQRCPVCPEESVGSCTHMFYTPLYSSHRSKNYVYLRPINVHSRGNTRTPTIFYTMVTYDNGKFLCCHEKTAFKCKTCSIVRKAFLDHPLIQPYLPKKQDEEETKGANKSRDTVEEDDADAANDDDDDDDDGWDSVGDGFGDEGGPPTGSTDTLAHKRTREGGDGKDAPPRKKKKRRGKKHTDKETGALEDMPPGGYFAESESDADYQSSDDGEDSEFWDDAVGQDRYETPGHVSISREDPVRRHRRNDVTAYEAQQIMSADPGKHSNGDGEVSVKEALFVALQIMQAASGTTAPQLLAKDRATNNLMQIIKHLDRTDTGKLEWLRNVTRRAYDHIMEC